MQEIRRKCEKDANARFSQRFQDDNVFQISDKVGKMANKQWKYEERVVAGMFNSKRALQKGTDTKEDIESDLFCVDTKLRQNWSVEKWFDELQTYSRKHNKIPILCLRKPGKKRRLAVVDMDNLVSILKGKDLISGN